MEDEFLIDDNDSVYPSKEADESLYLSLLYTAKHPDSVDPQPSSPHPSVENLHGTEECDKSMKYPATKEYFKSVLDNRKAIF